MELTDKELDMLDAYWNKQLSKEEYAAIESRLKQDVDFQQHANAYFLAISALKTATRSQKKDYLRRVDATMPRVLPIPFWQKREYALTMAASIIGIAACIWFLMPSASSVSPKGKAITEIYFKPFPNTSMTMGDALKQKTQEALDAYNAQNYSKAASLYAQVFEIEKDSTYLFFQAVSLLGSRQLQASQPIFEQIQYSNTLPSEAAQWYLALIYTEIQQKDKALPLLQKFAHTEGGGEARVKRKNEALELIRLLEIEK